VTPASAATAAVDALAIGETRTVDVFLGLENVVTGHVRYSDGTAADGAKVGLLPAMPQDPQAAEFFDGSAWRLDFERNAEKQEAGPGGTFRFPVHASGEYVVIASAPSGSEAVSDVLALEPGAKGREIELVLPRGGTVSGRVRAPGGASCAGLRIWIGTEKSTGLVEKTCRDLAADGSFEIGPIAPGRKSAYLLLPAQVRHERNGSSSWGGLGYHAELGAIEIVDGVHLEHDFEAKEFPGTIRLDVLVNGEAMSGVQVEMTKDTERSINSLLGNTDRNGTFGPAQAFPGLWNVMAYDPDAGWWCKRLAPVSVEAARASLARIEIQVAEAELIFLDATTGEPLHSREVALLGPAGDSAGDHAWQRHQTDARGRVRWKLAAGEYRFRLQKPGERAFPESQDSGEPQRVAPIVWTDAGPLVHEVRL
jgi:hypothetical protein